MTSTQPETNILHNISIGSDIVISFIEEINPDGSRAKYIEIWVEDPPRQVSTCIRNFISFEGLSSQLKQIGDQFIEAAIKEKEYEEQR